MQANEKEIKKVNENKELHNYGGGKDRGNDTNENSTETKSGKSLDRGISTNDKVKDKYHDQK